MYLSLFRLGGGLFGDTYVAVWGDKNVAVKRITIGVHQNQLQDEDYDWMRDEAAFLRYSLYLRVLAKCQILAIEKPLFSSTKKFASLTHCSTYFNHNAMR